MVAMQAPSSQLVVQVDHGRVNRRFGLITALNTVVLLGVLAGIMLIAGLEDTGALALAPLVVILLGHVFQMAFIAWIWRVQIGASPAMVISSSGISVPVPPYGSVSLAWEVIGQIDGRRQHLAIRPLAGVGPESHGVEAAIDRRLWRRLHRRGALVPIKYVDTGLAEMMSAIRELSTGRLATPPQAVA